MLTFLGVILIGLLSISSNFIHDMRRVHQPHTRVVSRWSPIYAHEILLSPGGYCCGTSMLRISNSWHRIMCHIADTGWVRYGPDKAFTLHIWLILMRKKKIHFPFTTHNTIVSIQDFCWIKVTISYKINSSQSSKCVCYENLFKNKIQSVLQITAVICSTESLCNLK